MVGILSPPRSSLGTSKQFFASPLPRSPQMKIQTGKYEEKNSGSRFERRDPSVSSSAASVGHEESGAAERHPSRIDVRTVAYPRPGRRTNHLTRDILHGRGAVVGVVIIADESDASRDLRVEETFRRFSCRVVFERAYSDYRLNRRNRSVLVDG
ncbi:hypothetical protein GWI33_018902 [Rhynchophorus ferrugineus]|uniref:Uncharacterized protein n=1 Tax=Rhynchophorus ferrugineus TaxID=354439 RepID=A0A834HVG4_RHYFE|nr:hypothetical protein GWI33_018902 [Rhynchophorus ferrugineus]